MPEMPKVVVFIPAYNEELTIGQAIDRVRELYPPAATHPKGYEVEILVVNDGSRDRTEEIARGRGVKVVTHYRNRGLGAATRTGLEQGRKMGAAALIKLDADLQHDPADIEKVVMPILEDKTDLCWGSRFAGQITYKMPLVRHWGNRFFTWLMNKLTHYQISDAQTGLMAFGRRYLEVFELYGDYNPPQQLLADADSKYMRYHEVPVVFHARTTGQSFVSLKYPIKVILNLLRVLVYSYPLKAFSSIGLGLIFFAFGYYLVSSLALKLGWTWGIFDLRNMSTIAVIMGIQCLFFGVLADLIIKKK
ncbi:MAG: glycosyltransferase family 2 protein [Desulfarculus sp.]|nr:glycosyltransferase family 2 protein [Desulfarculus sp.]